MIAFAVVRDTADLRPACDDLSALLGLRRQLAPDAPTSALLGVWVDPEMAGALPFTLPLPECLPAAKVRIRETNSRGDVWTLCWLESMAGAADEGLSRAALLAALLQASPGESPAPAAPRLFIPVFWAEAEPDQVDAQLVQLRTVHPHCVTTPLFQDLRTGRLLPPPELP